MATNPEHPSADLSDSSRHPLGQSDFNELVRNSFDMVVLLDANGQQKFVSESCRRILGFSPDELINIPVIQEMIHPEDQEMTQEGLANIIQFSNYGGTQYRHRHKNGSWVYLEAYGTNLLDHPSIASIVLNVRDISKRKEAEEKLRQNKLELKELNATKDRFISIIGHDLKNPLSCIISYSNLLMLAVEERNSDETLECAKSICESSNLVNDLLTNLLNWSRSQTERIRFLPEMNNLSALICEVANFYRLSADHKSIRINIETQNECRLPFDREMIHTVLRNLVSNAIKFSRPEGQIKIQLIDNSTGIECIITDDGVGISDSIVNSLFKIDRAHSTEGTQGESGTGLGLILCKEFIDRHDGSIWVESKLGIGTQVHFSLPRRSIQS